MRRVNQGAACASDLTLDEWSAGELDAATRDRVATHVESCPDCHARHASYEALRTAFLAESPSFRAHAAKYGPQPGPSARIRELRLRDRARRDALKLAAASLATLTAAAFAVLLIARTPELPSTVRSNGTAHVDFFVTHGAAVRRGERGETLVAGDALRFTYSHPKPSYLALFNLEAERASVYFPAAASAAPVAAGSEVPLDFSVELDAQLGTERVFALFCPEPFELEPLRAELAERGNLPVPATCQLDVIPIHKAQPR